MKLGSLYLLFLVFHVVQFSSCKEISLEKGESSKDLSIQSELSPHVDSAPRLQNKTESRPSSRRTFNRARIWTPRESITTEAASPASTTTVANNISESDIAHEKWKTFEMTMKKMIEGNMKKAIPMFLRLGSDTKVSAECSKGIMALVQGIRGMKAWAFRSKWITFIYKITHKKKRA